ncbi:hypothetical protein BDZ45DRAFT_64340 [Acephala macrosclerotiorum]|nr:hypothetical protein BDZ45DRAFT_64340 [Acephala macrosclerotiorum]
MIPKPARFQLTFSKGSRRWIGIWFIKCMPQRQYADMSYRSTSHTYSEIYLIIAESFRNHDLQEKGRKGPILEIFETMRGDVEMAVDFVSPTLKKGSRGVRLK